MMTYLISSLLLKKRKHRSQQQLSDMNFFKSSESELGVQTPRTASVLDVENKVMTSSTSFDHFQMNHPWDFLIRR